MSATTKIILDTRVTYARGKEPKEIPKNDKNRTFSVCVRVTYQRDHRRYPIGIRLSRVDFEKLSSSNLGEKLRKIKEDVEKEERRAQNIIKNLRIFSFSTFSEQFRAFQPGQKAKASKLKIEAAQTLIAESRPAPTAPQPGPRRNFVNQFGGRKYPREKSTIDFKPLGEVAVFYGAYIAKLEAKDQAGTVSCYMASLTNLLKYQPQLRFADVTDLWLHKYEKYMKDQGRSVTTISMYLRCLRRIFNMVIAKKFIDRDLYPFGRDLYVIPAARRRKKALKMADIQSLFEYECDSDIRRMAKDLWFFLYLGNGMNVKDMCLLKFSQIRDGFCRFIRAKTQNTTRENQQEITFFCDDIILGIIARWGNKDHSPENYIFPFLTPGMDGYAIRYKVQLVTHLINEHMYAMARELGISFLPGTNDARHAFATQLKRVGKDIEFVRQSLGHLNVKTTQGYYDDFEDNTKKGITADLLPFKKKELSTETALG
jgi:integrase/recombinase XerD